MMVKLNGCVFLIEDDDLLEKYNTISNRVSADTKKEFDSKPAYNKNILKTITKPYGDEAIDFHDKGIKQVGSNYTF